MEVSKYEIIDELYNVLKDRRINPVEGSYTNYLFNKGLDKILKKIGEESCEVVIAGKNNIKEDTIAEISDLFYHVMVLMCSQDISTDDILDELKKRSTKIANQKPDRKPIEVV
ncbi:MAG: phosphoribosyl-ATP diphosphatase [Candidatus Afipia apatlaquensis]|uniref:Phosphoribosyl-ATP pyrophosphatase n=1 Tax=Candidatus Afipia apatlaquensis TaxID=2712852 RepID=A0A7C9RIT1_9BRAD|nr:phosphoribosyl-ATP diphosphatase [Candidatus Afipia apatlaquensis]